MQELHRQTLVKTVKKEFSNKIEAGIKWFTFICVVNNIKLAPRELELLSFINTRGTISSTSAKEEFCKLFNSSTGTISNMVSTLTSLKLLVKEKSKTRVNPAIRVDFSNDFVARFVLTVKEEGNHVD